MDKPIELVKKVSPKVNKIAERFEPLEIIENKEEFKETLSNDSTWGG